jgi:acetyl-CoA C-acetyltransferase
MIQPTPGPNGHVYLVSAARTPIGKFGGALSTVPAVELGGVAIRAAVERAGLDPDTARIDEVLMGQVLQAGAGQAPARQALLKAGLPSGTSATTINRVCGSGLKAIMLAAAEIRAGDAEIVVAGGMESMNQAPFLLRDDLRPLRHQIEGCDRHDKVDLGGCQRSKARKAHGRGRVGRPPKGAGHD